MAEHVPIVSKESTIPIVEELSLQENIALGLEVTPTIQEPVVSIIEGSLPQENMAPGIKTTLSGAGPEVEAPAATMTESECLLLTPLQDQFSFDLSQCLRKVTLIEMVFLHSLLVVC